MKHFNRYHLGILPLLSILAMSPSVMQSKFASRAIASVDPEVKTEVTTEEEKTEVKPEVKAEDKPVVQTEVKTEVKPEVKTEVAEGHPKLDALVAKVDKESITKDLNLSNEQILEKQKLFSESVQKEKSEFKESSEEALVKSQREKTEALIKDLIVLEALSGKEGLKPEEKEALLLAIKEGKDILEGLLGSLEKNEELVAKAKEVDKPVIADNEEPKKEEEPKVEEPKVEEPKKEVVADTEEPKKEEPKTEEPKKEEEKPVIADKEEPKKEEVKEETKKEVCEADEKNKVLTSQVEELMKQNQQILQTMMGMAQMMVSMHQQNQGQGIYQQYQQMPMPNPYMYQQPMSAGNWVYYPSGFQPTQPNIFAQPMQQPMQQQMSIYPDQMHQQQWNLRPTQYFGDPRFQSAPIMPGTFGNEAFSFNMGNSVPTITQI